jgi:hypothetical protein
LAAGLGIMEVCSSNEMGAPNASHLEQKTTQPNRPKQTKISPSKRAVHLPGTRLILELWRYADFRGPI